MNITSATSDKNMTLIGVVSGKTNSNTDRVSQASAPAVGNLTESLADKYPAKQPLIMSKINPKKEDKKNPSSPKISPLPKKETTKTPTLKVAEEQTKPNEEVVSLRARLEEALFEKEVAQKKLSELTKRIEEEALIIQRGNGNLSKKVANLHCSLGTESLENVLEAQELLEENLDQISLVHKDWPTINHLQPLLNEIIKKAKELEDLADRMNKFRGAVRRIDNSPQPKELLRKDFNPYMNDYDSLFNDGAKLKADEKIAELEMIIHSLKHYAEPFKTFNQLTKNESKYNEALNEDRVKCEALLVKMKESYKDLIHMYKDSIFHMNNILYKLYPTAYSYSSQVLSFFSQRSEQDKDAPPLYTSPYA